MAIGRPRKSGERYASGRLKAKPKPKSGPMVRIVARDGSGGWQDIPFAEKLPTDVLFADQEATVSLYRTNVYFRSPF